MTGVDLEQRLKNDIASITTNATKFYNIVQGDATTEVPTDNGDIPSIQRKFAAIESTLTAAANNIETFKTAAETAATNAGTSETNAGTSETNAAGSATAAASSATASAASAAAAAAKDNSSAIFSVPITAQQGIRGTTSGTTAFTMSSNGVSRFTQPISIEGGLRGSTSGTTGMTMFSSGNVSFVGDVTIGDDVFINDDLYIDGDIRKRTGDDTAITINNDGVLEFPNVPYAIDLGIVTLDGSSSGYKDVQWGNDTSRYITQSNNNERFNLTYGGFYFISVSLWNLDPSSPVAFINIERNGGSLYRQSIIDTTEGNVNASCVLDFSAGDYINIQVYQVDDSTASARIDIIKIA